MSSNRAGVTVQHRGEGDAQQNARDSMFTYVRPLQPLPTKGKPVTSRSLKYLNRFAKCY